MKVDGSVTTQEFSVNADNEFDIFINSVSFFIAAENVVTDLNGIYGLPRVEIFAFRAESGESIVRKKLYYGIDEKVFVIVSIVNDRVLLIDTVHSPVKTESENK